MISLSQAALVLLPGVIRVGPLRLPVSGLFAAAGLIAALWLSQRTALLAGLSPDKLWDAGVFAVAAAFVSSRVLLVCMDVQAFLRYPLLVLRLPSLSYGGMLLTGLLVWTWLRWKGLPGLRVLDAWAPCAALLWAVLALGHFVEGTEAGMPTLLPWGVRTPGDSVLGRVHPVQMYAVLAALVLGAGLLRMLAQGRRAGQTAGVGLMLGGAASFCSEMLQQPGGSFGGMGLAPSQWVALAAMLGGAWLWTLPSAAEAAETPVHGSQHG